MQRMVCVFSLFVEIIAYPSCHFKNPFMCIKSLDCAICVWELGLASELLAYSLQLVGFWCTFQSTLN